MVRTIAAVLVAALFCTTAPVFAADGSELAAPSPAVAKAWARESKATTSSSAVRALYASYGVLQGLDMASTIAARQRGAIEANPTMQGGYAKGMAVKAAMGAVTMLAVRSIAKKNKKAAVITMIALNVATAAVVANNMRNAQHLK